MNYATLFANVKAYLESDMPTITFTASDDTSTLTITSSEQVNGFIQQAEQGIYNSIQFPALRKNVYGQVTANNKYLTCPTDFLAPYSMAVITDVTGSDLDTGTYSFLLNKDVNFIREAYPSPNDTGVPEYYALFGPKISSGVPTTTMSFILGPMPDQAYYMELHYFYYPESIVTAGTTWLGDNFDSALLYGTLVEAYTYLKGEADLIAVYDTQYKESLALAKRMADGMQRQDAYRSGQVRLPVK